MVATHGGPGQRLPDIDRQEVWDRFGRETVVNFLHVDSQPDDKGERRGLAELKAAIAEAARGMVREVPKSWQQAREALEKSGEAYMSLSQVLDICRAHGLDDSEADLFVSVSHRLGKLVHYEHDATLKDTVILKPDWLTTAISFVLSDEGDAGGAWAGVVLPSEPALERRVTGPRIPLPLRTAPEVSQADGAIRPLLSGGRIPRSALEDRTFLIAQLVDDARPDLTRVWTPEPAPAEEQTQISAGSRKRRAPTPPLPRGSLYQLIVRFHRYSLGRERYEESVHWHRGLVLEDDYKGRALLEMVGNDLRITVRSAFPERFLSGLTYDVEHLVEDFWPGLRCDVMVPCAAPCGKWCAGTGLFEVQKLIGSRTDGRTEYPCPTSGCSKWQSIEGLLRNAPAARPISLDELHAELADVKGTLRTLLTTSLLQHGESMALLAGLDIGLRKLLSKIDRAYDDASPVADGRGEGRARLFSLEPVSPGFFGRPKWISEKFRLTLWCEHSGLPVTYLEWGSARRRGYTNWKYHGRGSSRPYPCCERSRAP